MLLNRELKKILFDKAKRELGFYGFREESSGYSLLEEFEKGKVIVDFVFKEYESVLELNINLFIRLNEIEELINESNNLMSDFDKVRTTTIGGDIGILFSGEKKKFIIEDEEKLNDIYKEIEILLKILSLEFIEKYKNYETLFEAMRRDDEEVSRLNFFDYERALNAVALAKILNHYDLEEIKKEKRRYLEEKNDFGLSIFENFCTKI